MKHHTCPTCGREFHRARLLRWHLSKYCSGDMLALEPKQALNLEPLVELCEVSQDVSLTVRQPAPTGAPPGQPLEPSAAVSASRRAILADIRRRVEVLQQTIGPPNPVQAASSSVVLRQSGDGGRPNLIVPSPSARVRRRREAIFPAPVPRYRPPRWSPKEVNAVKKKLFQDDSPRGGRM